MDVTLIVQSDICIKFRALLNSCLNLELVYEWAWPQP